MILTDSYDEPQAIRDYTRVFLPFLVAGLLLTYRQYRILLFKEITIDYTDKDIQHALAKTSIELKWRVERNRDGVVRAYRAGMDWSGEMITIISSDKTILINSISDPNQGPTLSIFGQDRKNVRTFIKNLEAIVAENNV
jgi:hypothetical protein